MKPPPFVSITEERVPIPLDVLGAISFGAWRIVRRRKKKLASRREPPPAA